jgi:hypothetical protein
MSENMNEANLLFKKVTKSRERFQKKKKEIASKQYTKFNNNVRAQEMLEANMQLQTTNKAKQANIEK